VTLQVNNSPAVAPSTILQDPDCGIRTQRHYSMQHTCVGARMVLQSLNAANGCALRLYIACR
jgi:hypothetical protein